MPADREPGRERGVEAARQQQHRARADDAERRGFARNETDAVERNASRLRQCHHAGVRHSTSRPSQNENGIAAFVMKCCCQVIRRDCVAGIGHDNRSFGSECRGEPPIACGYDGAAGVRANQANARFADCYAGNARDGQQGLIGRTQALARQSQRHARFRIPARGNTPSPGATVATLRPAFPARRRCRAAPPHLRRRQRLTESTRCGSADSKAGA